MYQTRYNVKKGICKLKTLLNLNSMSISFKVTYMLAKIAFTVRI